MERKDSTIIEVSKKDNTEGEIMEEIPKNNSFIQKIIGSMRDENKQGNNLNLNTTCCTDVKADDCMNHNKTNLGIVMFFIGLIVGGLITYAISYYLKD